MRILIDGDGCPVVDRAISVAHDYHTPCLIFCDTAHRFERQGAVTITVSKGADSADFALVAQVRPEDIVVTQDYGLAAMCLSRGAAAIRTVQSRSRPVRLCPWRGDCTCRWTNCALCWGWR